MHARQTISGIIAAILLCNLATPLCGQAPQCGKSHFENAELRAIAGDGSSLSISDCVQQSPGRYAECVCGAVTIPVPTSFNRSMLHRYQAGDHVWVDISQNQPAHLAILQDAPLPSVTCRLFVLLGLALSLFAIAAVLTRWRPLKLIVGQDNRYSNSKFQIALWFWILLSTYLATVVFRVHYQGWGLLGGVTIPPHLLAVSGLAALTYGGAKGITTSKADAATQQQAAAPPIAVTPTKPSLQPGQERFFRDLFQNDVGRFDFGDFQMVIVTLLAGGMYAVLIFHFLAFVPNSNAISLPDVDTTILAAFGVGQGAYLTKKAAGNLGTS